MCSFATLCNSLVDNLSNLPLVHVVLVFIFFAGPLATISFLVLGSTFLILDSVLVFLAFGFTFFVSLGVSFEPNIPSNHPSICSPLFLYAVAY